MLQGIYPHKELGNWSTRWNKESLLMSLTWRNILWKQLPKRNTTWKYEYTRTEATYGTTQMDEGEKSVTKPAKPHSVMDSKKALHNKRNTCLAVDVWVFFSNKYVVWMGMWRGTRSLKQAQKKLPRHWTGNGATVVGGKYKNKNETSHITHMQTQKI